MSIIRTIKEKLRERDRIYVKERLKNLAMDDFIFETTEKKSYVEFGVIQNAEMVIVSGYKKFRIVTKYETFYVSPSKHRYWVNDNAKRCDEDTCIDMKVEEQSAYLNDKKLLRKLKKFGKASSLVWVGKAHVTIDMLTAEEDMYDNEAFFENVVKKRIARVNMEIY